MSRRVTLVCGPPCSGKTTYVQQHAEPDDLILCVDTFAKEAGSLSEHDHGKYWQAAEQAFQLACDQLGTTAHINAWVIRCAPDPKDREKLAAQVGATRIVVLMPAMDVVYDRAFDRDDDVVRAITSWYRRYRPSLFDEVIRT